VRCHYCLDIFDPNKREKKKKKQGTKIGTIQRRLAWPLRKDDTQKSRMVSNFLIHHYRQLYLNRPEPIAFMSVAVDTAGRIDEDFSRLLFFARPP
jgi:hypothetical protein